MSGTRGGVVDPDGFCSGGGSVDVDCCRGALGVTKLMFGRGKFVGMVTFKKEKATKLL